MAIQDDSATPANNNVSGCDKAVGDGDTGPPTSNVFGRIWSSLGLESALLTAMVKGALPPVITMAAYQSSAWSSTFSTQGYLVSIMAFLSMAMMPRAKFLRNLAKNVIFVCVGAAIALLQLQVTVGARKSTTAPGVPQRVAVGSSGSLEALDYNAAANTVSALGLFITVYLANTLRAFRPEYNVPVIVYSIFTIVASTYAPSLPDMEVSKSFTQKLLIAFLTGFAIATGVSLLVFPRTSRQTVLRQNAGFLKLLQASLLAHGKYLKGITAHPGVRTEASPPSVEDARAIRGFYIKLGGLFAKMQLELDAASEEIAYGKLGPDDLRLMHSHMRDIFVPVIGMTTILDVIPSTTGYDIANQTPHNSESLMKTNAQSDVPVDVVAICQRLFEPIAGPTLKALSHISIRLELTEKPRDAISDTESKTSLPPAAGSTSFALFLAQKLQTLDKQRNAILRQWLSARGATVDSTFENYPRSFKDLEVGLDGTPSDVHLVLYMAFLYSSLGRAILKAVQWADSKNEDETMLKKRLIVPTWRGTGEVFMSVFSLKNGIENVSQTTPDVLMGDSLNGISRDPEHLPITTAIQRATNYLRAVSRFFSSPESAFGFRCSVATMSIGILAYLEQTRTFFLDQRLQWAMFMIAVSMAIDAGHNVFEFVMRILGTLVAICFSLLIWYVCDQKTAAIIPVLFLYLFCGFYFVIKYPLYLRAAIISIMSAVLLIGYELQVRKIGIARATSNGQPYYPMYELAPYRLACVAGGLGVAFFWVYFPYPATTRHLLRQELGGGLHLLACLHSCVQSTVEMRLRSGQKSRGDEQREGSPTFKLTKARQKLFSDITLLLQRLRDQSKFSKYEPTIGGKFPKTTYDELITSVQRIFTYTMLTGHATHTFADEFTESQWLRDIRQMSNESSVTSHEMTSLLCLLSASITNGQPVPPYLKIPSLYDLRSRLVAVDPEKLSLKHISEPCFTTFSVLQICSTMISEEMVKVVKNVQELVGEVNFSFEV